MSKLALTFLFVFDLYCEYVVLAENIPRTTQSVYVRARRLFNPMIAAVG